jgi:hypothetical protein
MTARRSSIPPATKPAGRFQCLVELQQQAGGDALIGRRLYPLLVRAGYPGSTARR